MTSLMRVLLLFTFFVTLERLAAADISFLQQNSQPKYFLNSPDSPGLCGELYRSIIRELDKRAISSAVDNHYLPIKRILSQVETIPGTVFCGAGRNAEREKRFHYIRTPLYQVSNVVVTHSDDLHDPKSFEEIIAARDSVGALYGTSSARFLQKKIGATLVNDSFNDLESPLKLIGTSPHRLRYFYYHDLGLNYLVKVSPYPLRVVKTKFRTVPQWLIVSSKTPEFQLIALEEILASMEQSGELAQIVGRYIY